jgi:hypothetical protein
MAGAKAHHFSAGNAARLKSCPDTNHSNRPAQQQRKILHIFVAFSAESAI